MTYSHSTTKRTKGKYLISIKQENHGVPEDNLSNRE